MKHSDVGGSTAPRLMKCSGSVALAAGLLSVSSRLAAEGTLAHSIGEQTLTHWIRYNLYAIHQHLGEKHTVEGHDFIVDEPMIDAVLEYVHYIVQLSIKLNCIPRVEHRFHCPDLHPRFFGTADCVLWDAKTQTLHIIDYKHGIGVWVDVFQNWQLLYYAVGVLHTTNYPAKHIHLTVVQPRIESDEGTIRTWEISIGDLIELQEELLDGIHATDMPRSVARQSLNPGGWCQFCPVGDNNECPALDKLKDKALTMDFSEEHDDEPLDKMAEGLRIAEILKTWCNRVHEVAYANAKRGRVPKGWKLVEKKPYPRWTDPKAAQAFLDELVYLDEDDYMKPPQLRTPIQVSKLIGKDGEEVLRPVFARSSSGTTLVKTDDPRPEVLTGPEADFESLE